MLSRGSAQAVEEDIGMAIATLGDGLKEAEFRMADKITVLATTPGGAVRIRDSLAAKGWSVRSTTSGVDLGIDTSLAQGRSRDKHKARITSST